MARRKRRRNLLVFALMLVTGFAGVGARPGAAQTRVTVTIAQPADAVTLDPQKEAVAFTDNILVNVFESLIRKNPWESDPAKALQPWLGLSWREFGPDKWQVKPRPGVKFQDGEELTAQVVQFSFERLIDPATKSPAASLFGTLSRVDVVDKYSVNFVSKEPDPTGRRGWRAT